MTEEALVMPKVGESVTEGTILHWLKRDGDQVELDEPLVEIETEKVNVEIPSPWAGKLRITAREGEKVKVEEALGFIETGAEDAPASAGSSAPPAGAPARTPRESPVTVPADKGRTAQGQSRAGRYSPAVLNLAREHDIELTRISGTGLLGRVTRKDVLAYVDGGGAAAPSRPAAAEAEAVALSKSAAAPSPEAPASGELVPLTAMRRTIAERMVRSSQTIPHVWLMVEADVTGVVRLRQQSKEEFRAREGVDLTYLPFVVKAAVEGLKDHRVLNSSWTEEGILLKKALNIGIAVSTEQGLIVPVIHHADDLSIAGLARRIVDLAERARARKLRIEDVEGGTFTVDNTGAFGSIASIPIINHPQAAIMTVEAIVQRPVVRDDAIAIRHMVNLCLSFDHRVLDGAEAGAFLASVRTRLEAIGPDTGLF